MQPRSSSQDTYLLETDQNATKLLHLCQILITRVIVNSNSDNMDYVNALKEYLVKLINNITIKDERVSKTDQDKKYVANLKSSEDKDDLQKIEELIPDLVYSLKKIDIMEVDNEAGGYNNLARTFTGSYEFKNIKDSYFLQAKKNIIISFLDRIVNISLEEAKEFVEARKKLKELQKIDSNINQVILRIDMLDKNDYSRDIKFLNSISICPVSRKIISDIKNTNAMILQMDNIILKISQDKLITLEESQKNQLYDAIAENFMLLFKYNTVVQTSPATVDDRINKYINSVDDYFEFENIDFANKLRLVPVYCQLKEYIDNRSFADPKNHNKIKQKIHEMLLTVFLQESVMYNTIMNKVEDKIRNPFNLFLFDDENEESVDNIDRNLNIIIPPNKSNTEPIKKESFFADTTSLSDSERLKLRNKNLNKLNRKNKVPESVNDNQEKNDLTVIVKESVNYDVSNDSNFLRNGAYSTNKANTRELGSLPNAQNKDNKIEKRDHWIKSSNRIEYCERRF